MKRTLEDMVGGGADGNYLQRRLDSIALGIRENQHTVTVQDITTRPNYPAEGGYVRNVATGQVYVPPVPPGGVALPDEPPYGPRFFQEDMERREREMADPDIRFVTLVCGHTHRPLTQYLDREGMEHTARAESEYKRIREAQLKREASLVADKTAALATYVQQHTYALAVRSRAAVYLRNPNEYALETQGLADLLVVLHTDGTPGFLYPFYMRWQYEFLEQLMLRSRDPIAQLAQADLDAVHFIIATDTVMAPRLAADPDPIYAANARALLAQFLVRHVDIVANERVSQLALLVYHYVYTRDIGSPIAYVRTGSDPSTSAAQLTWCVLDYMERAIASFPHATEADKQNLRKLFPRPTRVSQLGKVYNTAGHTEIAAFFTGYFTADCANFFVIPPTAVPAKLVADRRIALGAGVRRVVFAFDNHHIVARSVADDPPFVFEHVDGTSVTGAGNLRNAVQVLYNDLAHTLLSSATAESTTTIRGAQPYFKQDIMQLPNLGRYAQACAILAQLASPILLAALDTALPNFDLFPAEGNNYLYSLPRGLPGRSEEVYRTASNLTEPASRLLARDWLDFYHGTKALLGPRSAELALVADPKNYVIASFYGTGNVRYKTKIIEGAAGIDQKGEKTATKINFRTLYDFGVPALFRGEFARALAAPTARGFSVSADGLSFVLPFDVRTLDRTVVQSTTKNTSVRDDASRDTTITTKTQGNTEWVDLEGRLASVENAVDTFLGNDTHTGRIWGPIIRPALPAPAVPAVPAADQRLSVAAFVAILDKMTRLTAVPLALDAIAHLARAATSEAALALDNWRDLINRTRTALHDAAVGKPQSAQQLLSAANRDLHLPTRAYMSAPHISGRVYFTPFFTAALAAGLDHARHTLGFPDVTLDALTDPSDAPLANAFAAWIGAHEGITDLRHPKQYMKDRAYGASETRMLDASHALARVLEERYGRAGYGGVWSRHGQRRGGAAAARARVPFATF